LQLAFQHGGYSLPNWCHNKLTISGDPKVVEECVAGVAEPGQEPHPGEGDGQLAPVTVENRVTQPLDFHQIVPVPAELLGAAGDPRQAAELRSRFRTDDLWEWGMEHWGTTGNAVFEGVAVALAVDEEAEVPRSRTPIVEPGRAFYAFETAYSPPVPVITALAVAHPTLDLELIWGEPGAGVAGLLVWREGKLHSDEEMALEDALSRKEMWF
jgi:hypothetical protein